MEDPKIINLSDRKDGNLSLTPRENKPYCSHTHIEVVETDRLLQCTDCGSLLDPFDWLFSLAKKERYLKWQMDDLKKNIEEAHKQKADLDRDINNLKAKRRRLL